MEKIKFRGKHIHALPANEHLDGIWIYGYLADGDYINSPELEGEFLINKDTVGQYIGFNDAKRTVDFPKGEEIYNGDILEVETRWKNAQEDNSFNDDFGGMLGIKKKGKTYWVVEHKVFSSQVGFMIYGIDRRFHKILTPNMIYNCNAKVAGNIWDTPELLRRKRYAGSI